MRSYAMNRIFAILCLLAFSYRGATVAAADQPGQSDSGKGRIFRQALGDYSLHYPQDHGAHPDYATEWWYFTGHLRSKERMFGFELVFFRVGVSPELQSKSAWAVESLYLAHFAITDDKQARFFHSERRSRGNFEQAGAAKDKLKVWLGPWRAEMRDEKIFLEATEMDSSLTLELQSSKPLVLHGKNGLSQKGPNPGDASYYSSFTRLIGSGSLRFKGEQFPIEHASAWMDQEFSSSKLSRETLGWDWFAIQLDNNEELMLYQLRNADGSVSPYSSGTLINSAGEATALRHDEFTIEVLERWRSNNTTIEYPAKWRIQIPNRSIDLIVTPTVNDQELVTAESTGVTYWEGRTTVEGVVGNTPQRGSAYVELVGYKTR